MTGEALTDRRVTTTLEDGYGRRRERREPVATTDLTSYLDWPDVAQVVRVEQTWTEHEATQRAVHSGITRLTPAVPDAGR